MPTNAVFHHYGQEVYVKTQTILQREGAKGRYEELTQ
jgi:hypothetical protein